MTWRPNKLLRAVLWLPAKTYEIALRFRVAAYETGYITPRRLSASVVSIGNITLGGTGKTPLAEYIARYLRDEDFSVAILSRGYKRRSSGIKTLNIPSDRLNDANVADPRSRTGLNVKENLKASHFEYGDEPVMLARALPEIPIIINNDRYEAGRLAEKETRAEVLVLDDGYQHLRLARDLNILVVDATDPFGDFEVFPLGRLREPLYGLKRADAIIITRANRAFDQAQLTRILKYSCGDKTPVLYFYTDIVRLRHLSSGIKYDAEQFRGWNSALLCGIGNPDAFAEDVLEAGISIVSKNFFRDHHAYTQEEFDRVSKDSRIDGAEILITTEKDAVKLEGLVERELPIYVAEIEVKSDDEVRLKSLLLRRVGKKK